MIFLSIILGIIVRIWSININYYFSGELGKELLYVHQLVISNAFPLVGLPTSHEWLNYGPVYYWILVPIYKFISQSPFILFWVALAVSIVGAIIIYLVFKEIVDKRFSMILSFFIALSPLWIWITRLSKLHTFFFVLMPLVIYFLYMIWKGDKKSFFFLGLSYGLLFSFHFSQIPQILVIVLVFYIKRKGLVFKNYFEAILGFILANATIIIYDAMHGFSMVKDLVLWIPYRFLGFAGIQLIKKEEVITTGTTLSAFNEFLGRNLFWDSRLWILGSLIFVIMFVYFVVENKNKITNDFFVFYVVFSTIVQFAALVIHKSPPIHYFLPIFLNFGLLFSDFTNKHWVKPSVKFLTVIIFTLLFATDMLNLKQEHQFDNDYVSLSTQQKVVDAIVNDAKGQPFKLARVGPFDYFPDEYKQNYEYLILQKGGKVNQNSKLLYTIFDEGGVANAVKGI